MRRNRKNLGVLTHDRFKGDFLMVRLELLWPRHVSGSDVEMAPVFAIDVSFTLLYQARLTLEEPAAPSCGRLSSVSAR